MSLDAAEVKAAVESATEAAVKSNAVTKVVSDKESEVEAAAQRRACGHARQPDPRCRTSGPQPQYAARPHPRPEYPRSADS